MNDVESVMFFTNDWIPQQAEIKMKIYINYYCLQHFLLLKLHKYSKSYAVLYVFLINHNTDKVDLTSATSKSERWPVGLYLPERENENCELICRK